MAGQYYDAESGLFYNWNRYYNPVIGRYISSDPIGIAGGLNTFNYVGQNPLLYTDTYGFCDQEKYPDCIDRNYPELWLIGISKALKAVSAAYDLVKAVIFAKNSQSAVPNPTQSMQGQRCEATNSNKLNHIFGKQEHNLNSFASELGSQEDAFATIQSSVQEQVNVKGIQGVFEIDVPIATGNSSALVTVRGRVINGVAKIGTAFIK